MSELMQADLDFERSERLAEQLRQKRLNLPEYLVANDAACDFVTNIVGLNRRLDKRIEKHAGPVVRSVTSGVGSFLRLTELRSSQLCGETAGQLTLITDTLHLETKKTIQAFAYEVGSNVSDWLCVVGRLPLGDNFQYKENIKSTDGEKTSLHAFMGSWAVDYATRFADAVVLQNAGIDTMTDMEAMK